MRVKEIRQLRTSVRAGLSERAMERGRREYWLTEERDDRLIGGAASEKSAMAAGASDFCEIRESSIRP